MEWPMEGYDGYGSNDCDAEVSALRNQKAKIDSRRAEAERQERLAEEKAALRKQIKAAGETPVA